MKTAVVAALPRELAGLTRGWTRSTRPGGVLVFECASAIAVCAGMGSNRVALAMEAAFASGRIARVLSVGLAGACDPSLRQGEVYPVATVIDTLSGERYTTGDTGVVLATVHGIAGVAEKRRLHASYGAAAVEMEAASVARLALARGVRFGAWKAISDEAETAMENLARFATADGQFREMAFALHTAVRPARWRSTIQLGRGSAKALAALTAAVHQDLKEETR